MLVVPYGRMMSKKKEVARGVALPLKSGSMYDNKPIPPDYARVDVMWTNKEFDEDKINIPTEEGSMFFGASLNMRVLWNKSDIVLDVPMPASARS